MNIQLQELYNETLKKSNATPQQLPFMDFVKQLYINLKKVNNKDGMAQIQKVIDESVALYKKGLETFNLEQLENLKEFVGLDKEIVEKRIKAIETLIEEKKNASNK